MGSEWDVFKVVQKVSDSDAGEDHVDGVPHVPVGEHQDVGEVEQGAENANQHGKPEVDRRIEFLKIQDWHKFGYNLLLIVTLIGSKSHICEVLAIDVLPFSNSFTTTACAVVEKLSEM